VILKKIIRSIRSNPLDKMLKTAASKKKTKILLAWNRCLGDIALGLYAIILRVRYYIPDAKITFLIRENLEQGFLLIKDIEFLVAPEWKRSKSYDVIKTLQKLGKKEEDFDLIIEKPDPTYWVKWQHGKVVPKLNWDEKNDDLYKKFSLSPEKIYVGVQPIAETNYGLWRNWPKSYWEDLFSSYEKDERIVFILFGYGNDMQFNNKNILDLRGKTDLFQLLSIIKNRCISIILPDSGILSMTYYLNVSFPINVISLWADPYNGILKQAVDSPNPLLNHYPLIGKNKNLSHVNPQKIIEILNPVLKND
jgi:ADP-heptose:LPS heptosyltransferase